MHQAGHLQQKYVYCVVYLLSEYMFLEFLVKFYGSCCDLADTLVILHYYTADYKKSIQVPMDIHTYIQIYVAPKL